MNFFSLTNPCEFYGLEIAILPLDLVILDGIKI
jgi:hypothetical protein